MRYIALGLALIAMPAAAQQTTCIKSGTMVFCNGTDGSSTEMQVGNQSYRQGYDYDRGTWNETESDFGTFSTRDRQYYDYDPPSYDTDWDLFTPD